ncbi:hypothetical protein Nepgr_011531 [Nepenthes gracilis]|uniref:Uncharacterized protein n=1 Tax=Nepenthes gracilis TaxID=150966 RepID=A0AAD3XME6_NEPGR|nr:hypothetical protein Nepgr_011531 [Nepenthes gracilis]
MQKLRVNGSSSVLRVKDCIVYGPCREYESKLSVLPGIADAAYRSMQMGKEEREAIIQHEIWGVARAIQRAADALRGQLI